MHQDGSRADTCRILLGPPGDLATCIQSVALLQTVRAGHPRAEICWLVERQFAGLVQGHKDLDQLVLLCEKSLLGWWPRRHLRRRLRQLACDVVLDPQSTSRSAFALWWCRARKRIGWAAPRGRGLSRWLNNRRVTGSPDRSILALLGSDVPLTPISFSIPRDQRAEAAVEDWILQAQLLGGFAVVALGADGKPHGPWARCCGQLARLLGERRGLTTVVLQEVHAPSATAERIIRSGGGHAIAAPPLDLHCRVALLRRARLVLGHDPGWLQLAAAAGTHALGLCPGPRDSDRQLFGSRLARIESHQDVWGSNRIEQPDGLADIPLESVLPLCLRLLDGGAGSRSRAA